MKFIYVVILLLIFSLHKAQINNYYFGNLHAHTGFSDGSKDSSNSGISDPAGAYTFAKLSQNFDFLGISEHNHYSSAHNPGFKLPLYQVGLNMSDSANKSNSFLSLFGMEWGVSSDYYGHLIIYGFNQLIGWETSVPNVTGANYNIYNAKADYDGIFRKIKNNPNAFCYLAHPNTNDYTTTNGLSITALANAPYNAVYDSAIVGTPLRSGLAFSTFTNYSDYPNGDYFSYYKKLLSIGYHLGIGYDHDNHNTTFGRNNAGRLVVLAPSLNKTNFFAAMKQMHFYASDDWNTKLSFTMNGNIMGSVLSGTGAPTFNIIHNDGNGEQASTIRIYKGYSNTSGTLPSIVSSNSNNNTLTFTDNNLLSGVEYFYFAEIFQPDGNWIVSSPIWYRSATKVGDVSLEEQKQQITFNYYPNPATKNLSISLSSLNNYCISLKDLSGRIVYTKEFHEKDVIIDLSPFPAGLYALSIISPEASATRKLIIE